MDKQFILSNEDFLQFKTAFKAKATAKQTTAVDILLYNIFRGKDPARGFSPITCQRKLDNGMDSMLGFLQARANIKRTLLWGSPTDCKSVIGEFYHSGFRAIIESSMEI